MPVIADAFDTRTVTARQSGRRPSAIADADARSPAAVAGRRRHDAAPPADVRDDAPAARRALARRSSATAAAPSWATSTRPRRRATPAIAAEERLAKWRVELPFREDLYRSLRAFSETAEAAALTGERRRLLDHWLREFRRAGQELEAASATSCRGLRARLVELEVTFQRNIGEFRDGLDLTPDELEGLPASYVKRLKPGDTPGTKRVTLEYPDVVPFMEQSPRRDLREQLEFKEWSKAVEENMHVLVETLHLRRRIAALLAYPSWAHYAMEVRMAGGPAAVERFYDDLVPRVQDLAKDELDRACARRSAPKPAATTCGPGTSAIWTTAAPHEVRGRAAEGRRVLPAGSRLGGPVRDHGRRLRPRLPRGRRRRRVASGRPALRDPRPRAGELLASLYADLFPRDGKFTHAAAFPLVVAHRVATSAIACVGDRRQLHPAVGRPAGAPPA